MVAYLPHKTILIPTHMNTSKIASIYKKCKLSMYYEGGSYPRLLYNLRLNQQWGRSFLRRRAEKLYMATKTTSFISWYVIIFYEILLSFDDFFFWSQFSLNKWSKLSDPLWFLHLHFFPIMNFNLLHLLQVEKCFCIQLEKHGTMVLESHC